MTAQTLRRMRGSIICLRAAGSSALRFLCADSSARSIPFTCSTTKMNVISSCACVRACVCVRVFVLVSVSLKLTFFSRHSSTFASSPPSGSSAERAIYKQNNKNQDNSISEQVKIQQANG